MFTSFAHFFSGFPLNWQGVPTQLSGPFYQRNQRTFLATFQFCKCILLCLSWFAFCVRRSVLATLYFCWARLVSWENFSPKKVCAASFVLIPSVLTVSWTFSMCPLSTSILPSKKQYNSGWNWILLTYLHFFGEYMFWTLVKQTWFASCTLNVRWACFIRMLWLSLFWGLFFCTFFLYTLRQT